jgi:tetratricopeptide (TPR) repeat protein
MTAPDRDRFARVVAILTVVTTLAAAGVAYIGARTIRGSGDAKVDSVQMSLDSLADQAEAKRAANLQYERFAVAQQDRRAAINSRSDRLLLGGDTERLRIAERRREWLADRTDLVSAQIARATGVSAITLEGRDGPVGDQLFPTRFFARHTTFGSQRLLAIRDASNAQDAARSHRISAYAVTLAMFATAVFLLGFSLTPEGRVRGGLFAGAAGILVVGGAVVTIASGFGSPPPAPAEAADAYAEGRVALETGDTGDAIEHFDRAIDLRPSFTRAYEGRALAIFQDASPQKSGYESLVPRRALVRSNADLRRALALGSKSADVLLTLGFGLFSQGLMDRDGKLLDEAVDMSTRAVKANPQDPIAALNMGVVLLATDRDREAAAAYAAAVPKILFSDQNARTPRPLPEQEAVVAGALTDLEVLARETGRRHADAIKKTKAALVGRVAGNDKPPTASPAVAKDFAVTVGPSEVGYTIGKWEHFDSARDKLWVQWYHRDPKLGWGVIPEISGPSDGQPSQVTRFFEQTFEPRCLPPGEYRFEAYLNGNLVSSQVVDSSHGAARRPELDRRLGMALCVPETWRSKAQPGLEGLVSKWESRGGTQGVAVIRLDRHADINRIYGNDDAQRMLTWALRRFPRVVPRGLKPIGPGASGDFANFYPAVARGYAYGTGPARGRMLAVAGYDGEHVGWVGVVYGRGDFALGDGGIVLGSLTQRIA